MMVHDKAGLPKPLPSSGGLGWKLEVRGFSVCWGISLGQGLPSSRRPLFLWLGLVIRGRLLLGGHVDHEVHHPVTIAEFIVRK